MSKKPVEKISSASARKICAALDRWSPHGLCSGTLVEQNGNPKKTIGCAIGCLALETLTSLEGEAFQNVIDETRLEIAGPRKKRLKEYIDIALLDTGSLPLVLEIKVAEHFDIKRCVLNHLITLNDGVTLLESRARKSGRPLLSLALNAEGKHLPEAVIKKVIDLRLKYKRYSSKRE